MKICMLSDHHVSVNPRLWKEAKSYAAAGHEVEIIAMWTSAEKKLFDDRILQGSSIQYKSYLNFIPGQSSYARRLFIRLRKRISIELQKRFSISNRWSISYSPGRMVNYALRSHADLYVVHIECAIWAGRKLIKAGKKVAYDFEDWYSRDYLVPERPVKLLESLEQFALEHAVFCTFPSEAMRQAVTATSNRVNAKTEVIYNGFSISESRNLKVDENKGNGDSLKLFWFSRTIGPGRGLEILIDVVKQLPFKTELHLLGDCPDDYKSTLENIAGDFKNSSLHFHPFVPHDELLSEIAKYDIGFAIEEPSFDSRKKTITNKILQYLQAGLLVMATDTDGQKEVAALFPCSVIMVSNDRPLEWVAAIKKLREAGTGYKEEQRRIFEEKFSWEAQEKKLLALLPKQ